MYTVERKFEIEMKLEKELSNVQKLRAAAARSSELAADVGNVLGACEQRLQQLEHVVLPLYGDTARLQQIHHNMERSMQALDHVISYYMVARDLADVITAGPSTASPEVLITYLEALDSLSEAQNYFNKNNPQSVELENINTLYSNGITKLENAFEELLARHSRPLLPATMLDMIALEEDSSVDSVSVSGSGSAASAGPETLRAAAGWLSGAGRPPAAAVLAVRAPSARQSLVAFRDYQRARSMGTSPLPRSKFVHRSDSTARKTSSRIHKALEKKANKMLMKASQTLEQSTGLAIGPRRNLNESYPEDSTPGEACDDGEAEGVGELAGALCRLARHEQRALLGLVPLPRLPALLAAVLADCFALLAADVERVSGRARRAACRCEAGAAMGWLLLRRLQRLQPELERALAPAPPTPYVNIVNMCQTNCVRALEEWVDAVRGDTSPAPVDGTVHQLAAAALALLQQLSEHVHAVGTALTNEPSYARALALLPPMHDRTAALLAIYMRKVLAQLNLALRTKSEQYVDVALRAIFRLNNTHYLLQGLQRSGLLDLLSLAEPECESNYRDMIQEHKTAYLQSWNKLLANTVLDEAPPSRLRDRDRQIFKEKYASFNRELEDSTRAQRSYSVPDAELRESLKRDNKETLLPSYTRLYNATAHLPFSKNLDKYVKYDPAQVAAQLDRYFDVAA